MQKTVHLAALCTVLLSQGAFGRVIYGLDHRTEVYEATPFQQKLAQAAATMISENKMTRQSSKPGLVQIDQGTLKEWLESQGSGEEKATLLSKEILSIAKAKPSFCIGERFTSQPNTGMCSGFLIAPDLLVTAGHCAEIETFCSEYRWVFGFEVNETTKKAGIDVKEENIYKCKKVVSNALVGPLGLDYAIVQLDRVVTNRTPIAIRNDDVIAAKAPLVVIGSPSGLPLKVAGGANVRENSHPFHFSANLDTFQGNSGSAVFHAGTGVIEGILVSGEEDFVFNKEKFCVEANKCADNKCRGETVTRMTAIPEVGIQRMMSKAAFNGDMAVLEKLLKLNTWVDFYTLDGQSPLMKAVQGGKINAINALIAEGADVNLKDALGNSPLHHLAGILNTKTEDILTLLINSKANLEEKNHKGQTPLLATASALNLIGTKTLIKNGADKNAVDLNGETILFAYARKADKKAVLELMTLGVDASIKNQKGQLVTDL